MVNEEEVQDVQIDQLVGIGEDGFLDFNLGEACSYLPTRMKLTSWQ
jgi:hypothetical protein